MRRWGSKMRRASKRRGVANPVEGLRTADKAGIPRLRAGIGKLSLEQLSLALIVTNSVEARPLTVGLQVFSSSDQGIDSSVICSATLMTSAPLLIGFLLFQRRFVQSFMRAGIR
jgi:hypothetical protein